LKEEDCYQAVDTVKYSQIF